MKSSPSHERGFSIVEIVIAGAIIVTIVTGAAASWQAYLKISRSSGQNAEAALMTEEAAEAIHLLRDQSWSTNIAPLLVDQPSTVPPYQLSWTGTAYQLGTAQVSLQTNYVRTLTFSSISRDNTTKNIVTNGTAGSAVDPDTRKVTVTVFLAGSTSTPLMQSDMLIHNTYAN